MSVELDLIKKYDRPGPRYTSYPTAPLFNEQTGADTLIKHLADQSGRTGDLSLYVHIPFCHKLCWYCGCNMRVSRRGEEMRSHTEVIRQEIRQMRPNINSARKARQIHFGGGTPNYIDPSELIAILDVLRECFPFADDAEISIEADPRHLNPTQIAAYKEAGFNRISMGVQDFQPLVQQAINRVQPFELVQRHVIQLREAGFDGINMDLIYGLPHQTPDSFKETVNRLISLSPDRVALFNYAHVPDLKPHMKLINRDDLPKPEDKMKIFASAVDQLTQASYRFIGMDHFAKAGDTLTKALDSGELHRNFQGYTTMPGLEMLAFGMSAITMLDRLYVQNISSIADYEDAVTHRRLPVFRGYELNDDDVFRRELINRLMCKSSIDSQWVERVTGVAFDDYFPGVAEELEGMTQDGLLVFEAGIWRATHIGRLLLRNIAMPFDRYLQDMIARKKARFSRTV